MNKTCLILAVISLIACTNAKAQDNKKAKNNSEKKEIVVTEKSTGKNEKMVIVVDGDKITINGKPADQYNGNKRIIIDGNDIDLNDDNMHAPHGGNIYLEGMDNKAMLGVIVEKTDKGALVKEVIKESAADKAGIKEGDIITKLNDKEIKSHEDLVKSVGGFKPGDVTDLTYMRSGEEKKVKATLGKTNAPMALSWDNNKEHYNLMMDPPMAMVGPKGPMPPMRFNDDDMWVFRDDRPKFGMSIEDYADGDGVKITGIEDDSNAAKSGLKEDDVITEADGKPIKDVDTLRETLKDAKDKPSISLKVLRNGAAQNITLKVPKIIKKAEL